MITDEYALSGTEQRLFARIVSRAWSETDFAVRYRTEPREVLAEHGISFPATATPPALLPKPVLEVTIEQLTGERIIPTYTTDCVGSADCIGTVHCSNCIACWQS